ncbi:MAG: GTPase [Phycisphaerae bacterium]
MGSRSDGHLALLADQAMLATLAGMGLDWTELDRNVAAAARFKRVVGGSHGLQSVVLKIVGLVGGASSGKSTLFNSLLGWEVSRISGHAHETLGPIAAVHSERAGQFAKWMDERLLLPGFALVQEHGETATCGALGSVVVFRHDLQSFGDAVVIDLPDVTSKMADDEGAVTRNLLPWFDGLLVVVDEERWFDAAVFDETVAFARNVGPRCWVVFNRTEGNEELTAAHRERLAEHATARHAEDSCISPFQPGSGYRPMAAETCQRIKSWITSLDSGDRQADLERHLRRRCGELLRENVGRSEAFDELGRRIDKELAGVSERTRLSTDLLTTEERLLLGLGHRFVPFFDLIQGVRRQMDRFRGRSGVTGDVDFDKSVDGMAEVLRHNLEHRFRRATDTIDRVILNSTYLVPECGDWRPQWRTPSFEERDWAMRIREHLDTWKAETARQSRRGDVAALAVGMPLLVADLLFLGGAGLTLGWTAAWAAGFLGGKGLVRAFEGSPAFTAYQTTVRAYQALIRESLSEQCQANLSLLPRRHLSMSDPILESIMHWSGPVR